MADVVIPDLVDLLQAEATFFVAIIAVGITIVRVLSTIVCSDDPEERCSRGKPVLSILIGVLGTIAGFYFGSTEPHTDEPSIVTTTLPDGKAGTAYPSTVLQTTGLKAPLKWFVSPPLPADLKLDAATGTITGVPKEVSAKTTFGFVVVDSATPPITREKDISLEIKQGR